MRCDPNGTLEVDEKTFSYGDPELLQHEGNYGVLADGGICILDVDNILELMELGALGMLLDTFIVSSGKLGGQFYFRCDLKDKEPFNIFHPDTQKPLGTVYPSGTKFPHYVMGPGSTAHIGTDFPEEYLVKNDAQVMKLFSFEFEDGFLSKIYRAGDLKKKTKTDDQRPQILIGNRPINEMSEEAIQALEESNYPPYLFRRGGVLVRIDRDERNKVEIKPVREDALRGILVRCARWFSYTSKGKRGGEIQWIEKPENPPLHVVKDILSLPSTTLHMPSLTAVTQSPIIHDDGTIIAEEGYDRVTRTYFAPEPDFELGEVPDDPTDEDVQHALEVLQDVFVDFPFVDDTSRWNTIGALLTAILRPVIRGPVPCWIVDKPQAGSGASLIQGAVFTAATGADPSIEVVPKSPEEWEKRTLATLLSGRTLCILDNISQRLRSDIFAAILTSREWKGRILGKSEEVSLPVRCFWMANGNNIQFGGDIPRRIWVTKIDPQMALPWQREGFQHPDLFHWVRQHRGGIVAAVMILARAWIRAGRPEPKDIMPIGGFEEWRHVIGGILESAGVRNFMQNAMDIYLDGDVELRQWENFITSIFEVFDSRPWTTADLYQRLTSEETGETLVPPIRVKDSLPDHLAEVYISKPTGFTRACGAALSKQEGRRFPCGYMIRRGQTQQRSQQWIVLQTEKITHQTHSEEVITND